MKNLTDYVVAYARFVYGAQVLYKNRMMYLKTEDDTYRIDLSLAGRSVYRFCSTTKPMVITDTCLARGFYRAAAHSSYRMANKIPTVADWEKFVNDAYAFCLTIGEES